MENNSQGGVKTWEMKIDTPIDINLAVKGLGGELSIFFMMLGQFENMSLLQSMQNLIPAYDNKDYVDLKDQAHTLKGTSSYIGAGKLSYACYYMQLHWVQNNYPLMLDYYPAVVEAAIELKLHSREIIAKNESK